MLSGTATPRHAGQTRLVQTLDVVGLISTTTTMIDASQRTSLLTVDVWTDIAGHKRHVTTEPRAGDTTASWYRYVIHFRTYTVAVLVIGLGLRPSATSC